MTLASKLAAGMLSAVATAGTALAQGAAETKPVTYRGPLSFGGTAVVTVDAPSAGKVHVRFEDAPSGLRGAIVGSYTVRHGEYTARQFVADNDAPPPETMTARLRGVTFRFTRDADKLSGGLSGLPNADAPGTATSRSTRLAGVLHASAATELPAVASIAGVYYYVRHREGAAPVRTSPGGLDAGQLRIERSGAIWECQGKDCLAAAAGAGQPARKLEPADQTRWPGVFTVIADGRPAGRLHVSGKPGDLALYMGDVGRPDGATLPATDDASGIVVMRSAEHVPAALPDGRWRCQHPNMRLDPQTGGQVHRGTLHTETLDMTGPSVRNRHLNRPVRTLPDSAQGLPGGAAPAEANGLQWVRWTPQRDQVFLPLAADTMAYQLRSTAPASFADQMGVCHRQRAGASRATKRSADRKTKGSSGRAAARTQIQR